MCREQYICTFPRNIQTHRNQRRPQNAYGLILNAKRIFKIINCAHWLRQFYAEAKPTVRTRLHVLSQRYIRSRLRHSKSLKTKEYTHNIWRTHSGGLRLNWRIHHIRLLATRCEKQTWNLSAYLFGLAAATNTIYVPNKRLMTKPNVVVGSAWLDQHFA